MTLERLQPLLDVLLVLGFCGSRITGFCSVSVFFASQYLTGIARRALILALTLILLPPLFDQSLALLHDNRGMFVFFLIKEVLIGVLFGWLTNFLFYVAQSVGFIIDTQRGASMASLFDPISNSQTSPLGDFLMKFTLTLAIVCGGLLLFLKGLYFSYEKVPVLMPYKALPPAWNSFFIHAMGGQLFHLLVLLGGPVLFILFLSEFGLGLVTRFAPQLNVFFLSMPIKSELAMLFFILYLSHLMHYFCTHFGSETRTETFLKLLMG